MRVRTPLVALIIAATALFTVGIAIERSAAAPHVETTAESAESGEERSGEAGEAGEGGEAHVEEGSEADDEEGTLLGIDLESTPLVVLAVLLSLGLALAVWLSSGSSALLVLTAAAMGLFAALDVRELIHQLGESAGILVPLAALVALLHAAAALVALRATMSRRTA